MRGRINLFIFKIVESLVFDSQNVVGQGGMFLKKIMKKATIASAVLIAVFCIALAVLTQVDFLGEMVLSQLNTAVQKELNVTLKTDSLSGNPFVGFRTGTVHLVRSGKTLLTAEEIGIRLSMISLLKNSPRLSLMEINGLKSDYDSLNSLLPKKTKSSKTTDIPIDKIELSKWDVSSKWGRAKITKGSVRLNGSEWFKVNISGTAKEKAFSAAGIIKKENNSWVFDNFSVSLEKGMADISGAVYPSLDLKFSTKNLDLYQTAELIPSVSTYGVRGHLSASGTLKGRGKDMSAIGKGSLSEAVIQGIPLSGIEAKWTYNKGLVDVELGEGKVFRSLLKGKFVLDTRKEVQTLTLNLSAKDLRFSDWTDKFGEDVRKHSLFLSGGITSLEADIKGPLNALVGTVEIAPSDISYNNMKFVGLAGKATFDGSPSGTVDFSAMHNGQKIALTGKCSFAKNTMTDLNLIANEMSLHELGTSITALKKYKLNGIFKSSASLRGITGAWKIQAELSSPQVFIEKIGNVKDIKAKAEYSIKEGSLVVPSAAATWNGASLTASGRAILNGSDTLLDFFGKAANLKTTHLYNLVPFFKTMTVEANIFGSWTLKGTAADPMLEANVRTAGGRFMDMRIDRFASDVTYKTGKLALAPMNVSAYDGSASLKCYVNLPPASAATWALSGKLYGMDIAALNGLLRKREDMEGKCTVDVTAEDKGSGLAWKAILADSDLRWTTFTAKDISGTVSGTAKEIRLDGLKVNFLRGENIVNGTISLAEKGKPANEAALNLSVSSKNINIYEALRKYLPSVRGIQGLVKGEISVGGTPASPSFTGKGTLTPLRYRGFMLPVVDVDFSGNMSEIRIAKAEAKLSGGRIFGSAKMFKKDGQWNSTLDAKGIAVDIKQFGAYLPDKFRAGLGGRVKFNLQARGKTGTFEGKGTFSSTQMKFMGITLKNVNAPFFISDGYAFMEDVKAEMNSGTLKGGVAIDMNKSFWGGNITALSVDISSTIKQAFPALKGDVTGKGDLKIRGEGETGRLSTIKGSGVIFMNNGEISQFEAVEAAKKYTSGKPLRFKAIKATFTYDGGYLTILPGSQATAPDGDPVYRYVMLDGMVTPKRGLSMFAMGKVNIRALNALLGAMQGVLSTGADIVEGTVDKAAILRGVLGGVLSGFTKSDFSFITMNIGGTIDSPTFSNIKVDKAVRRSTGSDVIPKSAGDPKDNELDGNTTFKLKFEIPVGPGSSKTPDNVKGQVLEQTLENILKNIDFGI